MVETDTETDKIRGEYVLQIMDVMKNYPETAETMVDMLVAEFGAKAFYAGVDQAAAWTMKHWKAIGINLPKETPKESRE